LAEIFLAWTSHKTRPIELFMTYDEEIDAIGLLCPLPVLKLRKRLQGHVGGAVVCLLADDPAAVIDVTHFCNEAGHELISQSETGNGLSFIVRKNSI
jgi:tRNA 2-thiouridine synthesizing protein A